MRRSAWRRAGTRSRATSGGVQLGRRRRPRGRGAVGHPRSRRDLLPHRHQGLRGVGRVGRGRRRLRADGRDDPVPVAARHPRALHGAPLPGRAAGEQGGRAGAVPGHVAAGGRRRRVRQRQRLLRPPRRRARDPHRPGPLERAAGGEPGAHGDRRGPSHLHLPVAVRLPGRRGDRQPPAPGRGLRPVVRPVEGAARRAPQDDRGQLRPAPGPHGRAGGGGARRRRRAAGLRRPRLRRARRGRASSTRASP